MSAHGSLRVVVCATSLMLSLPVWAQQPDGPPLAALEVKAEKGDPEAQFALGQRQHDGVDTPQDFAEAARWYALAAAQGHAGAQNQLARYKFEGFGGPQDIAEALRLFEAAASSGEAQYVFDLAKVLEQNPDTIQRAASLYTQAAEAGNLDAAVSLGVLYQEGRGVAQDYTRARALYEEPAAQGNARALNNLGLFYVRGTGVPQDYARAAEYFSAAAELGLPTAMTNLGVLYENGFGVPLDEARAKELYRAGGRQQTPEAAIEPTLIYDDRLQPLDMTQDALEALQSRAQVADPVALFQLGWVLLQSPDAPFQNQFQAAALFTAAAETGYGPAMANLGTLYFEGKGVPQDYVLGQMWLLRASAAGVAEARGLSGRFMQKMTAGQINQAQLLAKAIP